MKRLLPILLVVEVLAGCGGGTESATRTTTAPTTTKQAATGGCTEATTKTHKRSLSNEHVKLDADKTYRLVFQTNCGDFTITLNQKVAPNATGSLVSLAKRGFFDDTFFHRIVPGFVIQGGDPTASGTGGPGYSTRDRVPRNAAYTPGVVAMAKAGNEPPGTAGSQFFVVTAAGAGLTRDYALLGRVTNGMEVVREIGKLGDPASGGAGTPLQSVVIEKATVNER